MAAKKPKTEPAIIAAPLMTVEQYVEGAAAGVANRAPGAERSSETSDADWAGGTFEQALDMGRRGWSDGVKHVQQALAVEGGVEQVPAWSMDVAGAFPLVPCYLTGDPDCMMQQTVEDGPRRRVTLVYNFGASFSVTFEERIKYAAAAATLLGELIAAGRDVALIAAETLGAGGTNSRFTLAVTVRDYGAPLDLDRLAFAFHPAFHRRLRFGFTEGRADMVPVSSNGYGFHQAVTVDDLKATGMTFAEGDCVVILPSVERFRSVSVEGMTSALRTMIEEQAAAAAA